MEGRAGSGVAEARTAPLVGALCRALEDDGVRWCHWKSNAFLDRTRLAENDLDILVDREAAAPVDVVLGRLGFKRAVEASPIPGILHYYGHDPDADRLVHVHLHYRLVVGDDLTKNYRLPLERALLREAVLDGEVRVPPPSLELVALVVRLVLKHATWDAAVARRARMSPSARQELAFLEERADEAEIDRFLAECLPFVDASTFDACRDALAPGSGRAERLRAGRRLVAALEPCERRQRAVDVALKLWRRAGGLASRAAARPPARKRPGSGGLVVAVVGGDGAGKSTVVQSLHDWLAPPYASTTAHLGRPPTSLAREVAAVVDSVVWRLSAARHDRPRVNAWSAVGLARDRYRTAIAVRRRASRGEIVVCDRYPLPGRLTSMDAPRLGRPDAAGGGRVWQWLTAREQSYYRALPPPDLLVVLRVDPEIAVLRKQEEPAAAVRARWRQIWDADWSDAHVVDAGRPFEDVLREVKALVWARL